MKELLRNELLAKLCDKMDAGAMKIVSDAFDEAVSRYTVQRECTSIIAADETIYLAARDYIAVRKTEGLADSTLKNYYRLIKCFCDTIGKRMEDISVTDARLWFYDYQKRHGISDRTLNRMQGEIKTFFSFACNEGYITKDALKTLKRTKFVPKQKEALCQMDLERMLDCAKGDVQAYAMLLLLYATGCRASELTGIRLSDIDMDRGTIRVTGKGSKQRDVYFDGRAVIALKRWLDVRPDRGVFLFPGRWEYRMVTRTVLDTVKRYAKKAHCPEGATTHTMRHTTATIALSRGCPVQDVQRMLGHANISTTMIYAQVSDTSVKASHDRCVV